MTRTEEIVNRIRSMVAGRDPRSEKAKQLAEAVRRLGNYRWTGVYDVGKDTVSILAYSGPGAPSYPTFPVTEGADRRGHPGESDRACGRCAGGSAVPDRLRQHAFGNHRSRSRSAKSKSGWNRRCRKRARERVLDERSAVVGGMRAGRARVVDSGSAAVSMNMAIPQQSVSQLHSIDSRRPGLVRSSRVNTRVQNRLMAACKCRRLLYANDTPAAYLNLC